MAEAAVSEQVCDVLATVCRDSWLVQFGQPAHPLQEGGVRVVEGRVHRVGHGEGQVVPVQLGKGGVQCCPSPQLAGKGICLVLEPADHLDDHKLHQLHMCVGWGVVIVILRIPLKPCV